ncbi:type II toxin-antitoxin system RelE/ParE family toxin [Schaalia sp. Marseille-Q2122]|uniref:type II toxin-antitoxin system RelE/ParE family toxin n=1 Tax=Schaalia sp. Marseille-Q2122 TaxID=2736604 RepID=UPI00158B8929|nr:type II toxin-antitoxin system RelE/ParE family toxin [Schaalia sp. Marseille-Q2122]
MEILQTEVYKRWFRRLRDPKGKARINIALQRWRLEGQIIGDIKPLSDGVFEFRIHTGPGYRLYYMTREQQIVLLLIGGDKGSQDSDIRRAQKLAKQLKNERW